MYDAVVLAGGAARRLGGVDKAGVDVGGTSLLQRVLKAVETADHVVVVGPERTLPPPVLSTQEHPPGGGPVAGLAAGLRCVAAELVVVLACDLPFVTARSVAMLVETLSDDAERLVDGAQLVDSSGRSQPLAAVYRAAPLRAALGRLPAISGTPMRAVLAQLSMLDVSAASDEAWDCDTWADVARARRHVDSSSREEA